MEIKFQLEIGEDGVFFDDSSLAFNMMRSILRK